MTMRPTRRATRPAIIAIVAIVLMVAPAWADDDPDKQPKSFWEQDRMLGDLGGLRSTLEAAGVAFALTEQADVIGNVTGGLRQGAVFEGAALGSVSVDTDKAFGHAGGTFYVSAYQIHGRGANANLVGGLQANSGIEATRSTRLYGLYYEQALFGGVVAVRVGQFGADEEFMVSSAAALFNNSAFGFPPLPAADLPSGGVAYPLTAPGVRVRVKPDDAVTLLGAVFDRDPAGRGVGDPQRRDPSGTSFRVNDGVFAIAEAQYAINQGDTATGLPGTYRLGAWYDAGRVADQRFDNHGLSLASPLSDGLPARHRGDWSLYAVADQMIWKQPDTTDGGVSLFARIMGAPDGRNLATFAINAGMTWKGLIPGHDSDTLGVGVTWLRIGGQAQGYDRDVAFYTGKPYPVRDAETVFEVIYSFRATGWLQIQPDAQYVHHPGGNIPDPLVPAKRLGDAVQIGLTTLVTF